MANSLARNTTTNVLTKIWSVASLYIFVPLWIKFVGIEGYGIISFYTMLMTLMHFADAGLSATLTRELARGDKDQQYKYRLFRTIELIYVVIAILIFVFVYFLSDVIVYTFLKSSQFDHTLLVAYVRIMAAVLSFDFLFLLYNGGLVGIQKIVISNAIAIGYSISRSALVLIILSFHPSVGSFLWWQLFSIFLSMIASRFMLVRNIKMVIHKKIFDFSLFKGIWKYSFGVMTLAILAALITQFDKMITGNLLSLKELGYYTLACSIGQAVTFVAQPVGSAFYPELTRLMTGDDKSKAEKPFLLVAFIIATVSSAIGAVLFFYTKDFVFVWTHDASIVPNVYIPAKWLIIGNVFVSLQYSAYHLTMACGHTKTSIMYDVFALLIMLPSIYICTMKWGIKATPIPYVIFNMLAIIYMGVLLVKRFLAPAFKYWLLFSLTPLCFISVIVGIAHLCFASILLNPYVNLIMGGFFGALSIYILFVGFIWKYPTYKNFSVLRKFDLLIPRFIKYDK